MMVLDLRPFDIVEDVGFNELFKFIPDPFPNPNSFGNSDSFENSNSFENLEIFGYPFQPDILGFCTPLVILSLFQIWPM